MSQLTGDWRELAVGQGFTEGPVDLGSEIAFVSINRGLVSAAALDGSGVRVLAEVGGGPNGLARDDRGGIWIAQNGGRVMDVKSFGAAASIQRWDPDGSLTTFDGDFDAPNDCAFGPDGRLYVTDPHGRLSPREVEGPSGRVLALDPRDGSFEVIADGLSHPNGLCFTPDGAELLVNDTVARSIVALRRDGEGLWRTRPFDDVPWGGPDGMAFDAAGRLWVAATTAEGLAVREEDGTWSMVGLGPSFPTNVCFAGADRPLVVVTAARGGRVIAAEAPSPGLALFGR